MMRLEKGVNPEFFCRYAHLAYSPHSQDPEKMFDIPCDMVFPCSHRNEIDGEFVEMKHTTSTFRCQFSHKVMRTSLGLKIAFVYFTIADDALPLANMLFSLPPTEAAATLLADTGCTAVIEGANSPCTKAVSFSVEDALLCARYTFFLAVLLSLYGNRRVC